MVRLRRSVFHALVISAAVALPAVAADRYVFITSVSGPGTLGDWPDAGNATGVAAGDAICQARAAAAGLDDPQDYRAWLSSSSDDAYCRIHGLTGKRSAPSNCGQSTLPAAAGPWRRIDGTHFAADITQLGAPDYRVFLPPRLDENGDTVHSDVWAATLDNGAYAGLGCTDWTSSAAGDSAWVGSSDRTGSYWTFRGSTSCSTDQHLLCFQIGVGDPLGTNANWGRLAFVTSVSGTGDLSSWPDAAGATGAAAANAICRRRATAAGLPGAASFKAWLSTGATDARDRFVNDGPWIRLDYIRVAADLAALTDGFTHAPLNVTETGQYLNTGASWTGTEADGTAATERCGDWSIGDDSDGGFVGTAAAADASWTAGVAASLCDQPWRLYCFQDLPLVFGDGFESGTTDVWSSLSP
jgi:hypothetical protein